MPTFSAFDSGLEGRTGKGRTNTKSADRRGENDKKQHKLLVRFMACPSGHCASFLPRPSVRPYAAIAKHLMNSKRILHNLEQSRVRSYTEADGRVPAYNDSSCACGVGTARTVSHFLGRGRMRDYRQERTNDARATIRLCRFLFSGAKAAKVT